MIGQAINLTNLLAVVAVVSFGFLYSEFTVSTLKYVTTNSLNYVFAFLPRGQFSSIENSILSNVRSMKSIAEISSKYDTQFVPSQYTFSVWALIYFSLSLFGILSLLTNKEEKERIGRNIGPLFFVTNLLNIAWMVSFSLEYIFLSHLIIVGLWWTLFTLYARIIDVRYGYTVSKYPLWVKLPFSIYLAWISCAAVASTMMVLKHDIMKPFIDSFSNTAEKEKMFVYNLDFTSPVLAVVSLVGVLSNMLDEQQWVAAFVTLTSVIGLWFSKNCLEELVQSRSTCKDRLSSEHGHYVL
ncbi:predicted protein [Naegleria gruberi]|uniref:Predicted protein n=1 Tax=Naegleria gruberi TaxID=5762 RepID=D2V7J1_NAEGR|nr:uncharacterized protein NAEGRDRAFT_64822 [Naegleria gruberi]EFC47260.1 predicted protein [Naegleria gruberi]|eukprot:XP_002680004.1 predicted protein [Naegleria gruberi strain NEG-M]